MGYFETSRAVIGTIIASIVRFGVVSEYEHSPQANQDITVNRRCFPPE